jgi:hypothetical protein
MHNVQIRLSGVSSVEYWDLYDVSAKNADATFRVTAYCLGVLVSLLYQAVGWE